jgi:hypothetical protein
MKEANLIDRSLRNVLDPKWIDTRTAMRGSKMLVCLLSWLLFTAPVAQAALKPETTAAYQQYIAGIAPKMAAQNGASSSFLWIDGDAARQQAVRRGEIVTQKVFSSAVPDGMIQHWIAGVFLPGATLAGVERVDQDYADYGKFYGPDISRVNVVSRGKSHFVVAYRITKTKVVTAVLDTVQVIDYLPLGPGKLAVQSHSQSVRQVDNADKPTEQVLAEGEGTGFLWAMNSYWRMQERDGGVYMECEAITLSRGVPLGLGALINPVLQSFAEDSLKKTIEQKRQAVAASK